MRGDGSHQAETPKRRAMTSTARAAELVFGATTSTSRHAAGGTGMEDDVAAVPQQPDRDTLGAAPGRRWTVSREADGARGGDRQRGQGMLVGKRRAGDAGEFGEGVGEGHGAISGQLSVVSYRATDS